MGRSVLVALLLFASVAISHMGFTSGGFKSAERPEQVVDRVEIQVLEGSVAIDVSVDGNSTGVVHWTATLTLSIGVDSVDVHMTPDFPSVISVGLSIYDFTLTPSNPVMEGVANITASPGTSASERPVLAMAATARGEPRGNTVGVKEDSVEVQFLPFFSAEAGFAVVKASMRAGDKRTFVLSIENKGNAVGDFGVDVVNAANLDEALISVAVSDRTVRIDEKGKRELDVVVEIGDDAKSGGYTVQVKVAPVEERSGNVEGSALVTIDVRAAYASFIQGIFRSPLHLLIAFGVAVIVTGLLVFSGLKLRAHLSWRRSLKRIQEHEGGRDMGSKRS